MSQGDLDPTSYPEFRERLLGHASETFEPRSYPGYPRVALEDVKPRLLVRLDTTLLARRSPRKLGTSVSASQLARVLKFAHGVVDEEGRGPVPSAGGLQALELYVVPLVKGWLEDGAYHYDRVAHALARVATSFPAREVVPSLSLVEGGAVLFVVAGDSARVKARYGDRGERFLTLEAGHLMQNLALLATSEGLGLTPMGGFFEREIAESLKLVKTDLVLYAGVCG